MSKYTIENISGNLQDTDLSDLIINYRFGRYCSDWTLNIQASQKYELETLISYVLNNKEMCWIAKRDGKIVGLIGLKESKWDSDFWGMKSISIDKIYVIGKDDFEKEIILNQLFDVANEWFYANNVKFISSRADIYDLPAIHALEKQKFCFIESTCVNTYDIRKSV